MKAFSCILLSLVLTNLYAQSENFVSSKDLSLDDIHSFTIEELMNITIVSSTGTEQKVSQAPSIATVITAKQIERSSARTLDEVLAMVSGLKVYLRPINSQTGAYDIRGIRSDLNSQILTLINGVSIDRVFSGSRAARFTFPTSAIQRVEVIKGPGSAVYGADAFAGVINIITKDAKYLQNNSQAGVRYGSYDRAEVYGNYGEVYESGLEMGLNLAYMTSNGDRDRIIEADLQTTLDGIFGTSASKAPGAFDDRYDVYNMNLNLKNENFSMNLWAYISKDMGAGTGIANAVDPDGKIESSQFISEFNYDYEPLNDIKWNNKLILSYIDIQTDFSIFPAGTVLPIGSDGNLFTPGGGLVTFTDGYIGNPDNEEKKIGYESTLNISKIQNHEIRVSSGVSYVEFTASETKNFGRGVIDGTVSPINGALTDVTGTPYIYMPDVDRTVFFLSLQDEYELSQDWHLTAGVRYDHYSDFGDTINPRLGLVWNTSKTITTKLLYGRAFRAPTFVELYAQNNPVALGNKDIDPETIDTIEFATRYSHNAKFTSSVNLYWYEINDLIGGLGTPTGIEFQNLGKQHGAGVELEASYQVTNSLLLSADYAYRWTKNEITKEAVANVPKHIGHAMFDYSFTKNWYLGSEVYMVADTPREVGDTRDKIASYRVVNVSMGYKFNKNVEATIAARNLLDKKYFDPSNDNPVNDYPMEGLNLFAELKYRF